MTSSDSRRQVVSVQALRGIAALAVVVAHVFEHGRLGGAVALFMGRFGVEVFFVISGFVITLAAGNGRFDLGKFAIRRFLRVVPLYWGTTLLVAGLALALPSIFKTTTFDLSYFVKSMLFVPVPLPGTTDWRPLFKLGWTLNYEMFFYVVVAAFFWCRSGLFRSACVLSVMSALVASSFYFRPRGGIAAFYANLNLLPFMVGIVLCELYRHRDDLMDRLARVLPLLIVGAVGELAWALTYSHFEYRNLPGHIAITAAAVAIVLSAMSTEQLMARRPAFWGWLGDISYSLYLLHMFVVGAGWSVVRELGGGPLTNPVTLIGMVAMIVGSLILATLSFRVFEQPVARYAKRLTGRSTLASDKPLER